MPSFLVVDPTYTGGVVLTEYRLGHNGQYDTITSTNKVFTIDVPALTALRNE